MTSNEATSRRWVLAIVSGASFMVVLDAQVVAIALISIRESLSAGLASLTWVVNAYTLTFAVLLMAGAAVGDRFGRRNVFAGGIAVFVAASVWCATAQSATTLITARAFQGLGAAFILPIAMALLGVHFPGPLRGRALGIFASLTGLATICGPLAGGLLTEGLSWRWIFWINVPVGGLLIALTRMCLPSDAKSAEPPAPIDTMGIALAAAALLSVVLALLSASERHGYVTTIWCMTAAAGLVAAWIMWESRVAHPMIPLALFQSRTFVAANLISFLFNAALYGTLFFLPQYLQVALGYAPGGAGWRLLPWTSTLFLVAPLAGAGIAHVGERNLVVIGLLLQSCGLAWLARQAAVHSTVEYHDFVLPMVIAGVGVSMAMPAAQSVIFGAVAPSQAGKASGLYNTFRFIGGAAGVAITSSMFSIFGSSDTPASFSSGFVAATTGACVLSAAAGLFGLLLPGRSPHAARSLPAKSGAARKA